MKGRDPGAFIKKPVEDCTWRNSSVARLLYLQHHSNLYLVLLFLYVMERVLANGICGSR